MKGQASIETLAVVGLMVALLVPIVLILLADANQKSSGLSFGQARASGEKMAGIALEVYSQGEGARKVEYISFPQKMLGLEVREGTDEIIFTVEGEGGLPQEIAVQSSVQVWGAGLSEKGGRQYFDAGPHAIVFEYNSVQNRVDMYYPGNEPLGDLEGGGYRNVE